MKWIKKWKVQSSSGNGNYIVSIDENGHYGCSCPAWKFRRQECHHIVKVKNSGSKEIKVFHKPEAIPANVTKPIFKDGKILYPLVPIYPSDIHMEATIVSFMLKYGWSMSEIKERRHLPNSWTKIAILDYIDKYGMKEYKKF
ncbi:hypothetical protein ES705_28135 [subsurface metagenome]